MAQFRYRLQTLLDQKEQAKEDAQRALAERQKELRAEQEALEECRREESRARERLGRARQDFVAEGVVAGATGESLRSRRDYLRRLQQDVDAAVDAAFAQELRIGEAEERVGAARDELAQRSREVEVLNKHRERMERRFREQAERKEALEQEEMGSIIATRRRNA